MIPHPPTFVQSRQKRVTRDFGEIPGLPRKCSLSPNCPCVAYACGVVQSLAKITQPNRFERSTRTLRGYNHFGPASVKRPFQGRLSVRSRWFSSARISQNRASAGMQCWVAPVRSKKPKERQTKGLCRNKLNTSLTVAGNADSDFITKTALQFTFVHFLLHSFSKVLVGSLTICAFLLLKSLLFTAPNAREHDVIAELFKSSKLCEANV